ncbi:aminotransferase class III-fold pyridoxal phosphate-dependent enzyme, partial [Marinobacter alexandrii]|uniref:aminotransferase class III-fold pyridoxal phosphate-dependent enzyme n=1 Tax=Marinobacter alexandrii TaxID=2570351 RepID=UPI003298F17D
AAAGVATLKILNEGNVIADAAENLAPHFQARLQQLTDHRLVGQVRGRGMFAAVELVKDKSSREKLAPDSAGAVYCRNTANELGLMVRQTGDAMIIAPPLVCSTGEIDSLVDMLVQSLDATATHYGM